MSLIDIHAHLGCPQAQAIYQREMGAPPPPMAFTCPHTDQVNAAMFQQIGPRLNVLDLRLAEMDAMGVAMQVLSPNPAQFFYHAPPEVARQTAQAINDTMAAAVAAHPERFVALGTVPLQDTGMAIAELRRAVRELGLKGIEIGSPVGPRELADPALAPFFAEAEALGIVLFLHPLGFSQGERLSQHYLNNILGNPIESTVALAHLIFGGVLDAHPGLKLCVAHGGGFLPGYWGRMDHAWRVRADCRGAIAQPPSHYLRRVWLDTLVFDRRELDLLVAAHGAERLCLGTDYPFDMGEADPAGSLADLPEDQRAALGWGNARALFSLD